LHPQGPGLSPLAKSPARELCHHHKYSVTVDSSLVFFSALNKLWEKIMSIQNLKTFCCTGWLHAGLQLSCERCRKLVIQSTVTSMLKQLCKPAGLHMGSYDIA